MKKSALIITWLGTAAISLAAGMFIARMNPAPVEPETVVVHKNVVATPNKDKNDGQVALLQRRLKEAEDRIAELTAQAAAFRNDNTATLQRRGRMTDEELALLKTQDPNAYAEEMRRREERDAARAEWLESRRLSEEKRDNFFENLNMDRMSAQERETLESFIDDYQTLRAYMSNGGRGEDGQQIDRMQMMQLGMEVARRADDVRKSILKDYGFQIGYNNSQSELFADRINELFEATSLLGPGGPGRFIQNRTGGNNPQR